MHPPPPALRLHQKAAIGAVERMEETMRVLTLIELMRLSKIELCDLAAHITNAFPNFPEGSAERVAAVTNLHNIRADAGPARLLALTREKTPSGCLQYPTRNQTPIERRQRIRQ